MKKEATGKYNITFRKKKSRIACKGEGRGEGSGHRRKGGKQERSLNIYLNNMKGNGEEFVNVSCPHTE